MSIEDKPPVSANRWRSGLRGAVEYRRLQGRINDLLDEVGIPEPWDIRAFIQRVADYRGRPIELVAVEIPPGGPDAMWVPAEHVDVILYDSTLREGDLHWEQVLAHEAAHILLCHRGDEDAVLARGPVTRQLLELIAKNVDNPGDGPILFRETYSSDQETEAEIAASLIWKRAGRRLIAPKRTLGGADAVSVDELASIMERTRA
ncbi:hypothetical protein DMC64_41720 [Amycolatopsis sp. WAC 04197]|uniref:hypothetical protein n=1 Tax=Amycolatopsis sp. WAC 04197 TaxID=2203199 RepID=UPI000F78FBE0|nr:hypothetical protein [Amycolatopsis sp. WAC 04197]RSN38589.1 hypothetical protein DMC64_41720 [Amycolatopsis sp. WAC 04197]